MEDTTNLEDWEFLSDSDEINSLAFDDIIRPDYFALESNKLDHNHHETNDASVESIDFFGKNPMDSQHATAQNGELGIEESDRGGSFLADGSKLEAGIEGNAKGESLQADDSKSKLRIGEEEVGYQNSDAVGSVQESEKGGSFLVGDTKMQVGIEKIDSIHQNSSDGPDDAQEFRGEGNEERSLELVSSSEMNNMGSSSVGGGEKKVLIWWKLPLDILKLCASRARTAWSIPIAAAFIGILMVGRRLYKMKQRSKKIPVKISFEDKKAAARLLLRATHLNEVVARRVPVIRSPMLLPGGVSLWPAAGQL